MAQDYVVKAVRSKPKEWDSQYGKMHTWLIQVEGNGEPVQLNKKADSPAPQVGESIYGDIQDTEYGQKFKSQKKPFGAAGKSPRDDSAIRAQWSIGQAMHYYTSTAKEYEADGVETLAKELFAMVERVKQGKVSGGISTENNASSRVQPTSEKKDWAAGIRDKFQPDTVVEPSEEELAGAINMDDIPFN